VPSAVAQSTSAKATAKQRLLRAAAELIAEVGWGAVSSRMVAERAGVNNALVHYHFDSMEDLLRRAAEQVVTEAFAAPTRAVWRGPISLGMRAAVKWLGEIDVDAIEVGVLAESLVQARRDAALRAHAAGELEGLRAELTRAITAQGGHLADLGARGGATLLLAALDGLLLHRLVDPALDLRPAARAARFLSEGDLAKRARR
jgi:TetR/AcrR family transcriptional regulator, regulator of biofilm formation and stress response